MICATRSRVASRARTRNTHTHTRAHALTHTHTRHRHTRRHTHRRRSSAIDDMRSAITRCFKGALKHTHTHTHARTHTCTQTHTRTHATTTHATATATAAATTTTSPSQDGIVATLREAMRARIVSALRASRVGTLMDTRTGSRRGEDLVALATIARVGAGDTQSLLDMMWPRLRARRAHCACASCGPDRGLTCPHDDGPQAT